MTKSVTALYDTSSEAFSAVSALEAAGFAHSDISIVANNSENWHRDDGATNAAEDAADGAGAGAVVGGVGGLLTGLGIMAIPGLGPVVAAGWLVATAVGVVAGAAVGGAAGGIIGSLTTAGVPKADAEVYAEGVRRGGSLVVVRVADAREAEARSILLRQRAVDLNTRGRMYRESGWSSFDANAPAYTADEVARERTLYR
jgi:hypothetical protein